MSIDCPGKDYPAPSIKFIIRPVGTAMGRYLAVLYPQVDGLQPAGEEYPAVLDD
jgi:hypothetical protein